MLAYKPNNILVDCDSSLEYSWLPASSKPIELIVLSFGIVLFGSCVVFGPFWRGKARRKKNYALAHGAQGHISYERPLSEVLCPVSVLSVSVSVNGFVIGSRGSALSVVQVSCEI